MTPQSAQSLVEVLQARAVRHPERRTFIFLEDGAEVDVYTYRDLDRKARVVAAALQRQCLPGETALLLFPAGLEFVAAFFGCLYAGVIAVPTYPPTGVRSTARIEAVARDSAAAVVLTTAGLQERLRRRLPAESPLADLPWLTAEGIFAAPLPALAELPRPQPADLAFLQFTSGSTSAPKGVMVSHGNLMARMQLLDSVFHLPEGSTNVCWLPVYHDMGLIGHVLLGAYSGSAMALMSPTAFLQRPFLWLQAVSRYKCEASGGPNFAYELCVRRITPEERATLDLSHWRLAVNGAEPIRHDTLERFSSTFAECGFRPRAFFPSYGLAEATMNRHAWGKPGVEAEVAAALRQAVAEVHCVRLHDLLLLRPAATPKTTSGKIQRSACRELYLAAEQSETGGGSRPTPVQPVKGA